MARVNKKWTYNDLLFIMDNYPVMTRWQLAYNLKVTEQVLDAALRRYGLGKKQVKQIVIENGK